MLTKTNKIILIVFFSIIIIIIGFFAFQVFLLKNAGSVGYKEILSNKSELSDLINNEKLSDFKIDKAFSNRINDKLFVLDYKNEYKLVLWKINEYNGIDNSNITPFRPDIFEYEDLKTYRVIPIQEPEIVIQTKTYLPETDKLFFNIDYNTGIYRKEQYDNIDAYEFNLVQIGFSSVIEKHDIIISTFNPINVSFIISTANNNFICYMLYSIKGEKVDIEMLMDFI